MFDLFFESCLSNKQVIGTESLKVSYGKRMNFDSIIGKAREDYIASNKEVIGRTLIWDEVSNLKDSTIDNIYGGWKKKKKNILIWTLAWLNFQKYFSIARR